MATPALAQPTDSLVRTEDGRNLRNYQLDREIQWRQMMMDAETKRRANETRKSRMVRTRDRGQLVRETRRGINTRIGRQTYRTASQARGILLQRNKGVALRVNRSRISFSNRITRRNLTANRGRLLAWDRGRVLRQPSRYMDSTFRKRSKFNPETYEAYVPGVTSHVKEDLNYHINAKSGDGYLTVPDKLAGENWKVRLVSHPVVRPDGNGYLVQAGFAGTLGDDPTTYPVVLQFRMEGADQTWHVKKVDVISANTIAREGTTEFVRFVPDEATQTLVTEEVWDESYYQ